MIRNFADTDTGQLFTTEKNRRFSVIGRMALRKLIQLNQAANLQDMTAPPGNRLELLKGNYAGFHSIRVNDQWRMVFRWSNGGADAVAIMDYH